MERCRLAVLMYIVAVVAAALIAAFFVLHLTRPARGTARPRPNGISPRRLRRSRA